MPHRLVCPHCSRAVGVEDRHLGADLSCPHCEELFRAPRRAEGLEQRQIVCPACGHVFQSSWPSPDPGLNCPACTQPVSLTVDDVPSLESPPPPRGRAEVPRVTLEEAAPEYIRIPTEDGRSVTIREPKKVVRRGTRVVALRQLSPEEKRRRRAWKNAVFFLLGGLLLALAIAVLRQVAERG